MTPVAVLSQAIATYNPFNKRALFHLGSSAPSFLGSSSPSWLFIAVVSELCTLAVSFLSP